MSTEAAHRVIGMYFTAALAEARSWKGSEAQAEEVETAWTRWRAEEALDRVTAAQALMWVTNRAASAPAWVFAQMLDDRVVLACWLRDHPASVGRSAATEGSVRPKRSAAARETVSGEAKQPAACRKQSSAGGEPGKDLR
jgi:hypothetical protein